MKADLLLGLQWGDEGKGKIVDVLAPEYDFVARFQGGPNAGHTLEFDGHKHVLRSIPSGIFAGGGNTVNVIGNGVVLDPVLFRSEAEALEADGVDLRRNLRISRKAHLILPTHRLLDAANEKRKGSSRIGTTGKGIGPAYTDKVSRRGIRVGDIEDPSFAVRYKTVREAHLEQLEALGSPVAGSETFVAAEAEWFDAVEYLRGFVSVDSEHFINKALADGREFDRMFSKNNLMNYCTVHFLFISL